MAYTLTKAITDTRIHLKDTTENVWTDNHITYFINEAICIMRKVAVPYFSGLLEVSNLTDVINIDSDYKFLLPLFASARCFEQDEQNYRAVKQMNEFESRREEVENKIFESDEYSALVASNESEGVADVYFDSTTGADEVLPLVP